MDLCIPFFWVPIILRSKIGGKGTFLNKKWVLYKDCLADEPTCLSWLYTLSFWRQIPPTKTGSYLCFNSCSSILLKYQFSSEGMPFQPHSYASFEGIHSSPVRRFFLHSRHSKLRPTHNLPSGSPQTWPMKAHHWISIFFYFVLNTASFWWISKRRKRFDWTIASIQFLAW